MIDKKWRDFLELIGLVSIVATLILVAYEIRQNTNSLEVTTAQNYVELYSTITTSLTNPETAALFYRGV